MNNNGKWKRIQYDAYSLDSVEEKDRFEGTFTLNVLGKKLHFQQSVVKSNNSVGLTVWDSSVVLAKYLERRCELNCNSLNGKTVIEIGAGCGIPGIVACTLGAKEVILTDIPRVLDHLKENAKRNLMNENKKFSVLELSWGKTGLEQFAKPFDIILGADIIYHHKTVVPMLQTAHHLAHDDTEFLLAFEEHVSDAAEFFWKKVPDYFEVQKLPASELDSFYQDDEISVFRLKKKPRHENTKSVKGLILEEKDSDDEHLSDYSDDWGSDWDSE